jgi:transposase-like protein
MKAQSEGPKTLPEPTRYFADPDTCIRFVAAMRWPDGKPVCPKCGSVEAYFLATRRIWKCRGCGKQFSVKVGTIFEDSPIGLDKWLPAFWMVVNCKNGVSSYEIARALGVTQQTGWYMNHRIRLALQTGTFRKMGGEVEVDETFIGGRARYMHKNRREKMIKGRGPMGKAVVMGLLERHGADGHRTVTLKHLPTARRRALDPAVREHVEPGTEVFTDALPSYDGLNTEYAHKVIDHAEAYAEGKVHTNGLENF